MKTILTTFHLPQEQNILYLCKILVAVKSYVKLVEKMWKIETKCAKSFVKMLQGLKHL